MKNYYTLLFSLVMYTMSNAQSPGGFGTTNMSLWVKADAGTSSTTNGVSLTGWTDQSGSGNNGTQSGGTEQPTYQTVSTNYNPGINIDANAAPKQHFDLPDATLPGGASDYTVMYVANKITGTGFVIAAGLNLDLRANRFRIGSDGSLKNSWQNSASDLTTAANANIAGKRTLSSTNYLSGSGRNTFVQALNSGSNTGSNINTSTSNNKIGIREDGGGQLVGDVNEILIYTYSLSVLEQAKAETYLAVKYGITLDNTGGGSAGDYISTTGDTVWDASLNPSYHNNVIGIGREDIEGLNQKQSHTIDDTTRIYDSNLQVSNAANTGGLSTDDSYIVIGDNQGAMHNSTTSNAEVPAGCGLYSRLEREWKVTRTSTTDDFKMDITLNLGANPTLVNIADLRFLVDDDGDFSNGGTTCYVNGGGVNMSYNNPVLTITDIGVAEIPDNSTRYIAIGSVSSVSPLPIELLSYTAVCKDNKAVLNWSTSSELNNDYFTIEKSTDAVYYEAVARINGSNNKSTVTNYSWTDDNFLGGTTYYRLKQTDFNGEVEYYGVRTTTCEELGKINFYPNPFKNSINIQLSDNITYPITIEVLDYLGRKVHEETLQTSEVEISLNDQLPSGTYFVKVVNETTHVVERMVKMK